jgi:hypothetical protein
MCTGYVVSNLRIILKGKLRETWKNVVDVCFIEIYQCLNEMTRNSRDAAEEALFGQKIEIRISRLRNRGVIYYII